MSERNVSDVLRAIMMIFRIGEPTRRICNVFEPAPAGRTIFDHIWVVPTAGGCTAWGAPLGAVAPGAAQHSAHTRTRMIGTVVGFVE